MGKSSCSVSRGYLISAQEGNQFPLATDQRVLATSGKYVLFSKIANTLWGICKRIANTLRPEIKLARGLPFSADSLWHIYPLNLSQAVSNNTALIIFYQLPCGSSGLLLPLDLPSWANLLPIPPPGNAIPLLSCLASLHSIITLLTQSFPALQSSSKSCIAFTRPEAGLQMGPWM
jgi:hypothetical protein